MLKKLIRYFFPKKNPFQGDPNIVKAFTVDGVDFYTFEDPLLIGYQRSLVAMEFTEDLNTGISKDFYNTNLKALKNCLNSNKLVDAIKIVEQLENTLKWRIDPDLIFKLASVLFFTEEENPSTYDYTYNEKKVKFMMKHSGDFFLQMPLKSLIPSLELSHRDTLLYLLAVENEKNNYTKRCMENIKWDSTSQDMKVKLQSQLNSQDFFLESLTRSLTTLQS